LRDAKAERFSLLLLAMQSNTSGAVVAFVGVGVTDAGGGGTIADGDDFAPGATVVVGGGEGQSQRA